MRQSQGLRKRALGEGRPDSRPSVDIFLQGTGRMACRLQRQMAVARSLEIGYTGILGQPW